MAGSGKGNDANLSRSRNKNDRRSLIRKSIIVIASGVLLILLLVLLWCFFFVVRDIQIVGVKATLENEYIASSGIEKGDSMFTLSRADVERRLKAKYPYVRSVLIDREFPSGIVLTVKEEYTTFYFELNGEFFLYNMNMRLIDRFDSKEGLLEVRSGAIPTEIPEVSNAVVPEYIMFDKDADSAHVAPVIAAVSSSRIVDKTVGIKLTDKFNIVIDYDSRIKITVGKCDDIAQKLKNVEKVLDDYDDTAVGTIDITDVEKAIVYIT